LEGYKYTWKTLSFESSKLIISKKKFSSEGGGELRVVGARKIKLQVRGGFSERP
jgi:hypothetical protein